MPHELTMKNVELFCKEVFPHFRGMWDDQWENKWWPTTLREKELARKPSNGSHQPAAAK